MLKNDEIKLLEKVYNLLIENGCDQLEGKGYIITDFRRLINREKQVKKDMAAKSNAYNKANKEKYKAYNAEYMKTYYQEHKENYKKYMRDYYARKKAEKAGEKK